MVFGVALFVTLVAIVLIWIMIEIKRLKHKIFAIFMILLILSVYASLTFTFRGQEVDLKSIPGVIDASKLYFSWLSSVFVNLKSITGQAIKMDWTPSNSSIK